MNSIPYFEVFAFTNRMFAGNPAGVCLLEEFLPNEQLQAIATQNDLPETAFVVERGGHFDLRWMTPAIEVDLCGHATLAAAHVLFRHRGYAGEKVRFQTQSGELLVEQSGQRLVLDFPSRAVEEGGDRAAGRGVVRRGARESCCTGATTLPSSRRRRRSRRSSLTSRPLPNWTRKAWS